MKGKISRKILAMYQEKLGAKEVAVYKVLAVHSNKKNWSQLNLNTIQKETGYSRSSVQKAIKELISLGLITKAPVYDEFGALLCNKYHLMDNMLK